MKDKIMVVLFFSICFSIMICYFILPQTKYSYSERRTLTTIDKLLKYNLLDDNYSEKLEDFAVDQIVLRDTFKSLKSHITFDILKQKDEQGYFYIDNHWFAMNDKYTSDGSFSSKMNIISNEYENVKLLIIPTKNYYLNSYDIYKSNYNLIINDLNLENIETIVIDDQLELDDYYYTDPHLKQSAFVKILPTINNILNVDSSYEYQINTLDGFSGSYQSFVSYKIKTEKLEFYSNDILDNVLVNSIEKDDIKLYHPEYINNIDSYDVFMAGPNAFVHIENHNSATDKNLIIFGDSYATSLTPLIVESYANVYVIDLRYISFDLINNYIKQDIDDVLLVYSELSITNNKILKVSN